MNVGYRNVNCGIFYLGLVEVIAIFKYFIRCICKGVVRADMKQHAPSTVPGDGVLIIPEESSGKYSLSVITSWLSLQVISILANAFIYPRNSVVKLLFFSLLDFVSSIFTSWYHSFSTKQTAKKWAILMSNFSVPTGRDEELVPSAHANNDVTFCIFSK